MLLLVLLRRRVQLIGLGRGGVSNEERLAGVVRRQRMGIESLRGLQRGEKSSGRLGGEKLGHGEGFVWMDDLECFRT